MDLMDLLQWQLSDGVINGMDNQLHIGDAKKTNSAANAALTILMGAISKNATSSESALTGLSGALDRDHDGSILDDLMGLMTGQKQASNPKMLNGSGILNHVLGNRQNNAIDVLSKTTGLQKDQSMSMLIKLAPMVLGVLGRYKKKQQMDTNGLQDYLKSSQQKYVQKNEGADIFTKFLDQDGDGSVMDDVAGMGMKFLGNLLKR